MLYLATLSISKIIWMNRWVRGIYCSDTDTGIQNNSKQNLTCRHFVHHKSHVNYLGTKTSIPGEKPVNNQLSSGSYQDQLGTAVAQWLRCCATNWKVTGSILADVSGFFIDIKSFRSHYGPNRNEYQGHFLGVKAAGA